MMKRIAAVLVLAAPAIAAADPAPADLNVHELPAKKTLAMRPHDKAAAKPASTTTAAAGPAAGGTAAGDADTSTTAHFNRLPTNMADLRERVIFRLNAGYELDSAPASGQTLRGGAALPPGFSDNRQWISGDVAVGAHDIVMPSLGGYFLGAYQFDTTDTLATRTQLVVPGDAADQRVVVKAGYAEYQTDDKNDNHLWIRAGRQFRLDGGSMFAYYDGATVGYRANNGFSMSVFGGQRVQLYLDPSISPSSGFAQSAACLTNGVANGQDGCQQNPGIMFGATLGFDLKKMKGIPAKIAVDYEGLAIDSALGDGDSPINTVPVSQTRSLIAASANIDVSRNAHLDIRARGVDTGDGFGFGRAGAHFRVALSKEAMLSIDADQRGPDDYAYDLAAVSQVDVVDISRRLGVGLAPPINSTMAGAQLDYRKGNKEALIFARANVAEDTVHFTDQQGWEEAGIGLAGAPLPSTWVTGTYTFRHYDLDDTVNVDNSAMGVASPAFDDLSGSGLRDMHEFALDGWWRSKKQGDGQLRVGAGAFYRIYDMQTPYVSTDTDGRGGGRLDLQYWLTRELHVMGMAEVAQPSPTLMREIDTMTMLRIALEARW
jgi:hypothetical protein|nr:hypothetical protein [Kofleriaceae bacterium]